MDSVAGCAVDGGRTGKAKAPRTGHLVEEGFADAAIAIGPHAGAEPCVNRKSTEDSSRTQAWC